MIIQQHTVLHRLNRFLQVTNMNEKSAQRRCKHCALAVVRWTHKHTDRGDYNTLHSLVRSVIINTVIDYFSLIHGKNTSKGVTFSSLPVVLAVVKHLYNFYR